jgi:serine/threonine protein kinase
MQRTDVVVLFVLFVCCSVVCCLTANDIDYITGAGQFGVVYEGKKINDNSGKHVAMKSLKLTEHIGEFIEEINTLIALKHPSIVEILGLAYVDNQLMALLELCEKGMSL